MSVSDKPKTQRECDDGRGLRAAREWSRSLRRSRHSLDTHRILLKSQFTTDSLRENDESTRDHRDPAFAVLKGIFFGACGTQPEVPNRVRMLGLFALRVGFVKTKDSTSPILERS